MPQNSKTEGGKHVGALNVRVREALRTALVTDVDFDAFCTDCFPAIRRKYFASSMTRLEKETLLLQYNTADEIHNSLIAWDAYCNIGQPEQRIGNSLFWLTTPKKKIAKWSTAIIISGLIIATAAILLLQKLRIPQTATIHPEDASVSLIGSRHKVSAQAPEREQQKPSSQNNRNLNRKVRRAPERITRDEQIRIDDMY